MATTGSASSVTDIAAELRIAVTRTARRLRQETGLDLTGTQIAALAGLDVHGPQTPSELAARERIQRPTATRMIARLEERGLVVRTRDPEDGRVSVIALTDEGRRIVHEQRHRKTAFFARRLQELQPAERELLEHAARLLERMLDEERP
jgi:DNA-binding MarR family transcriptional regulator